MRSFVEELIESKQETLEIVSTYIINTIESKALYRKGGWKEVNKKHSEKERFNHNFSVSATAICIKLRENNESIDLPIQSNMRAIESLVNKTLGVVAVEYYVDRKNHALRILL